MIVRKNIACQTCGHIHTFRIGIGGNKIQNHTFNCVNCGEPIAISLTLDFENAGWEFNLIENAEETGVEGTIINLDPDFPVETSLINQDSISVRLPQIQKIFEKQQEIFGETKHITSKTLKDNMEYDALAEWRDLKKCWSLSKNNHDKIVKKRIEEANNKNYYVETIDNFKDWLFKFCFKTSGRIYDEKFNKIATQLTLAKNNNNTEFEKFKSYFNLNLYEEHFNKYFDVFKDYFIAYSTFNQLHSYTKIGLEVPGDFNLTLFEFEKLKMFYGNCYETITSAFETLALLNNILSGRAFDTFDNWTLAGYKESDKSSRHNPFNLNPNLSCICDSLDNQLRNGSHHKSFINVPENFIIKYRSGKGGTGLEREISYIDYVLLCERIFCNISVLLRIELLINYS